MLNVGESPRGRRRGLRRGLFSSATGKRKKKIPVYVAGVCTHAIPRLAGAASEQGDAFEVLFSCHQTKHGAGLKT